MKTIPIEEAASRSTWVQRRRLRDERRCLAARAAGGGIDR
jgi:hypothetical protein